MPRATIPARLQARQQLQVAAVGQVATAKVAEVAMGAVEAIEVAVGADLTAIGDAITSIDERLDALEGPPP